MPTIQTVSVFGSARPQPGSDDYQLAEMLGRLLGKAGYTVMTGGYMGTMEATSKGAQEAGAHVIGITCKLFEEPPFVRSGANPYVDEVIRYDTLRERIYHVVSRCNAAITLPGGIGTLTELMVTWNFIQTGEVPPMPFILMGEQWGKLLNDFYDERYISARHMDLWQVVSTPEAAVKAIQDWG